MKPFF